ncbi:hypothetical protein Lal_00022751 [Lupinus albus]|nr:hypothetical protein Lal_00022751 [Lupinus albus]
MVRRQMETKGKIITWEAFRSKFLQKYYPTDLEGKEDDVRVRDTIVGKVNSSRDYGPQRNPKPGRGKEKVGKDRRPYAPPNNNRNHSYQGSKPS